MHTNWSCKSGQLLKQTADVLVEENLLVNS